MSHEDTFAAGRKFLSRAQKISRAAFSMATLVINVLPWDPAHHPSAEDIPSHFVPFEFVLEEVLSFLPTETLVVTKVSVSLIKIQATLQKRAVTKLVDCVTFCYGDVDGVTPPQKNFGIKARGFTDIQTESFVLREEEYIEQVSFHHGDAWNNHSLFAVTFITNHGRSSLSYGKDKNEGLGRCSPSTFKARPGHQITGLVRGRGFCPTITDIVQMPLDPDLTQLVSGLE